MSRPLALVITAGIASPLAASAQLASSDATIKHQQESAVTMLHKP